MRFVLVVVTLMMTVVGCGGSEPEATVADVVDDAGVTTAAPKGGTTVVAESTTTAPETEAPPDTTAAPATTPVPDAGTFSFEASIAIQEGEEFFWTWSGVFSVVDDRLVGTGTMSGATDGGCSIEDGPEEPVVYTAAGEFDIIGAVAGGNMQLELVPTGGAVDLTTGDTSKLCVEISVDYANAILAFPLGNEELAELPIVVPAEGGATQLDFGDGFVIDVTITRN